MTSTEILVVDDDRDVRNMLSLVLANEGFTVRGAASGMEALTLIHNLKPRAMITDLMMPEMSGEELCRIVKQDPSLRDMIIFILSVRDDLQTKLNCFSSGVNEYLVKPTDPHELAARLRHFIRMVDELVAHSPPAFPITVDVALPQPKLKYGVYRLGSLVGSGGMGRVFKGYDEFLERDVAIKILNKDLANSPIIVERFQREAKLLAAINHPGIANIYSIGKENQEHYFAMEWCPGGSLSDRIGKNKKLELLPAVDLMLQCAHALFAAWKKGVVHRDIKPSNLMFDEDEQIKIVDFGIAQSGGSPHLTAVSEIIGTPQYLSPEQGQGAPVDHRTDIYSLGITFYYMLYGKPPFKAKSAVEIILKHISDRFPQHDPLNGKVPVEAYAIIEKMTQKEQAGRYQDYPALIHDLEKLGKSLLSRFQLKIPEAKNVSAQPMIRGGNLSAILAALRRNASTGLLVLHSNHFQKQFWIRNGEIIFFKSNDPEENIWDALVLRKLLNKEDAPPAGADLEESLNHLLLSQVVSLENLRSAFRGFAREALLEVFQHKDPVAEFFSAGIDQDGFFMLPMADILLEASRSLVDYSKVSAPFSLPGAIVPTSRFEPVLLSLGLKAEESFIASRLEPDITIDTLRLLTGFPEEQITRFISVLKHLDAVKYGPVRKKNGRPSQETVIPIAKHPITPSFLKETPTPTPTPSSTLSSTTPRSTTLTPSSTPSGRKQAELAKVRLEVRQSDKQMEVGEQVKSSEQLYRMAQQKFDEGDYWKATHLCRHALKNNTDAKYHHLMALAYAKHQRFSKDAEQSFLKAIELSQLNSDYYLDLAEFYIKQGLSLRAINQCKRIMEIEPQHERANEMYRHLRATLK